MCFPIVVELGSLYEKQATKKSLLAATEIWVADSTGANLTRVTSIGGSFTGNPDWAPDGKRLAFDSRIEGNADIYVVSATGGPLRRLTSDSADDLNPAWSADGR